MKNNSGQILILQKILDEPYQFCRNLKLIHYKITMKIIRKILIDIKSIYIIDDRTSLKFEHHIKSYSHIDRCNGIWLFVVLEKFTIGGVMNKTNIDITFY